MNDKNRPPDAHGWEDGEEGVYYAPLIPQEIAELPEFDRALRKAQEDIMHHLCIPTNLFKGENYASSVYPKWNK